MLNSDLVNIWLGYGCAKKGPLEVAGGFIFGIVKGVQVPLFGTNVNSGARFSLMPPYSSKIWLDGMSYKLPVSVQLKKPLMSHCLFKCGKEWTPASGNTIMSYYAQQWMRGYWAMTAGLDETGDNLRVPGPCYASKVHWMNSNKYELPPVSSKWKVGALKVPFEGPNYQHFKYPDWKFEITALEVAGQNGVAPLPHLIYHFKMYNSTSALAGAKAECNKYYDGLKYKGV